MIKKKISLLIAGAMALSLIAGPINQSKIVFAAEKVNSQSIQKNNKKYIYLSDIEYDTSKSNTAYGEIVKDLNHKKETIKLNVAGKVVEFDKGMGAHATSTLVYNLSQYSDDFSRFVAYLGVDQSAVGSGNGVKFTISTSIDGEDWKNIETDVLMNYSDAEYVDINIEGVKYLKLHAHDNGSQAVDHSVYGDAKLVKDDYDVNSESLKGILKVEDYDNLLRKYTVDENINKNEKLILRRALVKRVGYDNLQKIYKKSDANKEAIDWLLNDSDALELYITGGQVEGTYTQSLQALSNVYAKHKDDLKDEENGDLYKKMMISLAISHAKSIGLWTGSSPNSHAPNRYEIYKKLYLEDKLANKEMFKKLPVELMRWVMNNSIDDEEISWLNQHARKHKTKTQNYDLDPYRYISYDYSFKYNYNENQYYSEENKEKWDNKYKLSENGVSYGTKGHHKLWMVFQEGSVCGGLSKTGTNLNQVFGIPGAVIGQPAHAAYLTYSENKDGKGLWSLGNDISGWTQSEKGERLPLGWGSTNWDSYYNVSYILLSQGALNDYENYVKALKLNLLAESYSDKAKKEEIYKEALKIQKFNLDSIVGLINTYKAQPQKTSKDYLELSKIIVDAYTYYPVPLVDVLNLVDEKITDKADLAVFDLLKTNALNKASVATSKESLQFNNCRNLAKSLLGKNTVKLATFSFSGENANKIIINSKYKDVDLKVRYSLDGGQNWTMKNEHSITLSSEELSKINADNDIRISLEGTDEFYTIDIKKAEKPKDKILFKNDLENRVVGKTAHLQYSIDGEIWTDHNVENKFEGDIKIMFRYKPNGVFLQSDIAEYQFKEDTDTETNKYITVDKLKFVKASSQQSNSSEHKATNMLDANYNTGWHTRYSGDNEKYYIVEFDDVKYLSSVDYVPFGLNGRLKNGVIYTSLDGKDWKESAQIKNLKNNEQTKNIKLQKPTEAKFVKIVATSTYGHYTQENKFFSGKVFNFYEDITLKNNVEVEDRIGEQNRNGDIPSENITKTSINEEVENKSVIIDNMQSKPITTDNKENNNEGVEYVESKVIMVEDLESQPTISRNKDSEVGYVESKIIMVEDIKN